MTRFLVLFLALVTAPLSAHGQSLASEACNPLTIRGQMNSPQSKAAILAQCESIASNTSLAVRDRAFALLGLGVAVMNDEPARGQGYFDRVISLTPENDGAYLFRGVTFISQQKWDMAHSDLSRAIELNPRSAIAWQRRGSVEQQRGRKLEAIADYSRSIELDPQPKALAQRGHLYIEAMDYEAAIRDFTRVIESEVSTEDAASVLSSYAGRAGAYALMRDLNRAEQDIASAERRFPQASANLAALKSLVARLRSGEQKR